MRLHYIVTLPLLCAATVADPGSDSGSGPGSDNAGHGADVVYLPVESLQHQLLNTTGLVPDSLVAVTASYGALKDESPGLAGVTAPNTTAYASVLIVPAENFAATTTAATGKQEATSVDELSGRTQLMYNCTSAPNLWNMQEDPDVLRLVNFQQFSSNVSNGTSTSSSKTEVPRKIVAIASVEVSYCATVQKTAVGRPVLVNAFFAEEFNDTPIFYYTTNSSSLRSDTDTSASGSCVIRLDMAQANFSEVYPNCKITFQSTDLDNIIHLDEVPSSSVETNKTRRLDLDSFGFVEDPACTSGCGEGGAAPDQCWVDGTTTALCQLQFYGRNADCDYECGNKMVIFLRAGGTAVRY
ncbi:Scavenger receptor class F member 1 [Phytophthora cinnamomi]|uniref:Scavenger receptor class F member 1 n=1 Tax=Phytophthora cinnamomi TaxID=4785 RepID=UPI003559AA13|nr:Scavenger receptor class F member 1 [Phytophthora cinnamomi]